MVDDDAQRSSCPGTKNLSQAKKVTMHVISSLTTGGDDERRRGGRDPISLHSNE